MNSIKYRDYNVNQILSTQKNPGKRNLIKINDKYYFQIPNNHEQTLESNDEASYKGYIQIKENGSYAKILRIQDLYEICQYFQLEDGIAAVLIFQFAQFQEIQENFIQFFKEKKKEIDNDVLGFIQRHNRAVLSNLLRPLGRYDDAFKKYSKYLTDYDIFNRSLVNVCYLPVNIQKIQELTLQNKSKEIRLEEREKFIDWVELLNFKQIISSTIFNEGYDLKKDDVWTVQRVQQYLDESINNLQVNKDYIKSLSYQQIFYIREKHLNNLIYPPIKIDEEEQKCTVEMRLKNEKYRLAVKSQSCEFLQTLFYRTEFYMTFNTSTANRVRNEIKVKGCRKYYLYLDLKDFCLNIDYNIVEKVFFMPQLANYLRQRKVYYVDPVTKKEELLILKKGIIIGEVYHNYIATGVTELLTNLIKDILDQKFQYDFSQEYSVYFDDFFIDMDLYQEHDQSEFIKQMENTLKVLEQKLNDLGFDINKKKLQLLANYKGKIKAWKINEQFQFKPSESFVICNQDLLKDKPVEEKESKQQKIDQFLNNLGFQQNDTLLHQANIDKLSKIEQYLTVKFLKTSKFVDANQKKAIIQYILDKNKLKDLFSELNQYDYE
ncbi:hypothetical protein ABPG74_012434 [Tetrahymena malaccensis]